MVASLHSLGWHNRLPFVKFIRTTLMKTYGGPVLKIKFRDLDVEITCLGAWANSCSLLAE